MALKRSLTQLKGELVKINVAVAFAEAGHQVQVSLTEGYDFVVGDGHRVRARSMEKRTSKNQSYRLHRNEGEDCDIYASWIEGHGVCAVWESEMGSKYSINVGDPESFNEYNREQTHFIENHRVEDLF